VRDYWRSQEATLGEFANRLTGSSDLYQDDGRKPYASINFVTAHDGFTLNDLVSYNEKHNEANGEDNRDGESHNRSWNLGAEGPTDDPEVNARRARQRKNFLATLLISQGVPMIVGGDEIARTQNGNNNAYCQDNEISWLDWEHADRDLLEFTRRAIAFRHEHPAFRRRRWFRGRPIRGKAASDVAWFKPDAAQMSDEDWNEWFAKSFAVFVNGDGLAPDERGRRVTDTSFLLLFNAHTDAVTFTLPGKPFGTRWRPALDTAVASDAGLGDPLDEGAQVERAGLSLIVLERAE
jgi:isoamylase